MIRTASDRAACEGRILSFRWETLRLWRTGAFGSACWCTGPPAGSANRWKRKQSRPWPSSDGRRTRGEDVRRFSMVCSRVSRPDNQRAITDFRCFLKVIEGFGGRHAVFVWKRDLVVLCSSPLGRFWLEFFNSSGFFFKSSWLIILFRF